MIYGYDSRVLDRNGLKQMREVSFSVSTADPRAVASHLLECADAIDEGVSKNWHRHLPSDLARSVGCDVIVLRDEAMS